MKCLELIQDLKSISGTTTTAAGTTTAAANSANVANSSVSSSVPHSPNGVLDAACLSYKSDERTVGSCPSSSHSSPDTKRRKLDQTATVGGDSWISCEIYFSSHPNQSKISSWWMGSLVWLSKVPF